MKRNVLSLFLALLLAFSLSACNGATTATQTLYQRGMEVVSLLDEMVGNENYLRVYSASDEMLQLLRPVAEGDYTTPKAVYRLFFANDDLLSVATGELSSSLDLPDTLTSYLQSRVPSVLISQLNAQSGAEVLAASTRRFCRPSWRKRIVAVGNSRKRLQQAETRFRDARKC